ncbi:zinc finger protein 502-like [Liolophura sinensis]|uniref:zinc finger protein 502-like n=1 Tax=Liolophura sinensis TaxID=3198878 RepID=UPI003159917C
MNQDIVMRDQIQGTEPNQHHHQQQQEVYNMDFSELKTISYDTTVHQPPVYSHDSAVQLMSMSSMNPPTEEPSLNASGCSALGPQSGFVLEPSIPSQNSGLPVTGGDMTAPGCEKTFTQSLPVNSTDLTTKASMSGETGPRKEFLTSSWDEFQGVNGNTVAGSGGTVTESKVASLNRSMDGRLTEDAMGSFLSALQSALSPGVPDLSTISTKSLRPSTLDYPDGLCNLQLLTYTSGEGIPNVKLVTVTDAILISVQFKCRLCGKSFTSPEALSSHSRCHTSDTQPGDLGKPAGNLPHGRPPISRQIRELVDGMVPQAFHSVNAEGPCEGKHSQEGVEAEAAGINSDLNDTENPTGRQRHCHICNKMFPKDELWRHFSETHLDCKECQCFVCGKKMRTDKDLLRHMMSFHTGLKEETVYRCAVCDRNFASEPFLLNHMLQIHPDKGDLALAKSDTKHCGSAEKFLKSSCANCEGTGVISSGKHSCRICKKALGDSRMLQKHMSEHSEQTMCTVCHKLIFLKSLPKHMMLHTKPKAWECTQCDRAYRDKCDLRKHMRIHTGEKPYTCEICNKSFAHSSQLPRHLRTHSGEKPYQCSLCQKVFSRKFGLQQHMSRHAVGKAFKCSDCGKEFRDHKGLKKHSLKHNHMPEQADVSANESAGH